MANTRFASLSEFIKTPITKKRNSSIIHLLTHYSWNPGITTIALKRTDPKCITVSHCPCGFVPKSKFIFLARVHQRNVYPNSELLCAMYRSCLISFTLKCIPKKSFRTQYRSFTMFQFLSGILGLVCCGILLVSFLSKNNKTSPSRSAIVVSLALADMGRCMLLLYTTGFKDFCLTV